MALTPQDVRDKTFSATRMKVGYNEDEVDAFLDEVEAELTRLYTENAELKAKLASAPVAVAAKPGAAAEPEGAKRNPFAIELRKPKPGEKADTDDSSNGASAGDTAASAAEITRLQREVSDLRNSLSAARGEVEAAKSAAAAAAAAAPVAAVAAAPAPATEDMLSRTLVLAQKTADEAVSQAREEAARLVAEAMDRAVAMERQATVEQQAKVAEFTTTKSNLEAEIERLRAFEREYRTRLKAYLEMQLRDLVGAGSSAPVAPAVTAGAVALEDDIEDAVEED